MRSMCMKTCCALDEEDAILGHVAWRGDRHPLSSEVNQFQRAVNDQKNDDAGTNASSTAAVNAEPSPHAIWRRSAAGSVNSGLPNTGATSPSWSNAGIAVQVRFVSSSPA